MDWKQIDFDWNKAKAFLATAEAGTFSGAAKSLKLAQPTLGRQVAALEEELGVALFEKNGNSIKPTPSGLELLEHVRKMAEAAHQLALSASGQSTQIEGIVRIAASEAYAVYLLPSLLLKLRQAQPKIILEVVASNESSDLRRREADIAIRNYRPRHQELIAKRLGDSPYAFYAAPKYLETFGPIRQKEDLNSAEFIGFTENEEVVRHLNLLGLKVTSAQFPLLVNSHLVQWELVKAGAGIGFISKIIGDAEPLVQEVLPGAFPNLKVENWLVSHRDLKNSRRIRVVFEFLTEEFGRLFHQPKII
ncbi:MAG: LysR family transcriptional regulator [bacterium]|nr:LysR family transcriptional regulator [bacterium]